VAETDKKKFYDFYNIANGISFGKISSRQDGYLFGDYKLPRCTSILQMDGTKAGALMEWAKREVSGRIEHILTGKLIKGDPITEWVISDACREGLAEPDKQKNEAAEVGTGTHDEIEDFLTSFRRPEVAEYSEPVRRFAEAWEKSGLVVIGTEIPVVWYDKSGKGFGGRLDILAYKEGKFYIGDNKTSRSVHESYGLQIGAYKAAVEQMSHGAIKIAGGYIFHIPTLETLNERQKKEYDKRGSLIELRNLDDAFEHYRLLLELYYKRNNKYF
jgi:hypothetical protein